MMAVEIPKLHKNDLYTEHRTAESFRSSYNFKLMNNSTALLLKVQRERSQSKRETFLLTLSIPIICKSNFLTTDYDPIVKSTGKV